MNNLIIKMVQTKKEKLFIKISGKTCYCASAVDRYWFVFLHVFFSGKTSDIVLYKKNWIEWSETYFQDKTNTHLTNIRWVGYFTIYLQNKE